MAARESDQATEKAPDKAMDGLLRETLRDAVPSSGPCPEPEILAAYFERTLDKQETADYELHLSQCARCREQQAAMALAHAPARETESEKPRWAWLWDWRWLAPATAVLAAAVIWYGRSTEITAEKHPQLAVARSEPAEPPVSENVPLAAENKLLPPPPPPSSRAIGAPEKTEREQSVSRQKDLLTPTDRKAADEFASNLETDALKKESEDVRRDANAPSSAGGVPPSAPAPAAPPASSAMTAQNSVAVDAIAGAAASNEEPVAAAKTKQAAPLALANRNANFAASNLRSRETLVLVGTPNPQILWRFGSAGLVERSVDGGATWAGQIPSAGAQLTAGSAPAEKICWLAGRGGMILLTTNGADWKTITAPAKMDFSAIVAKDAFGATVTTTDGHKFTTADGGETWRPAS